MNFYFSSTYTGYNSTQPPSLFAILWLRQKSAIKYFVLDLGLKIPTNDLESNN